MSSLHGCADVHGCTWMDLFEAIEVLNENIRLSMKHPEDSFPEEHPELQALKPLSEPGAEVLREVVLRSFLRLHLSHIPPFPHLRRKHMCFVERAMTDICKTGSRYQNL